MSDILAHILTQFGYLGNLIIIPLATFIFGRKLSKIKKETGKTNKMSSIIFRIFFVFSILVIFEFIVNAEGIDVPIIDQMFGSGIATFNIYSLLIGTIATLGMSLMFFGYRWEALYDLGIYFFGGMYIFYMLTGFDAWLESYIYIAGVLSIFFLYLTGFRIKDNGALGLAVFFTLAFGTLAVTNPIITQIIIITYDVFIMIFALGYFKPFKHQVEVSE